MKIKNLIINKLLTTIIDSHWDEKSQYHNLQYLSKFCKNKFENNI